METSGCGDPSRSADATATLWTVLGMGGEPEEVAGLRGLKSPHKEDSFLWFVNINNHKY